MTIYIDPSLLVALYLPEARTPGLRKWLSEIRSPIGLNVWQELEFKNAARQKVRRGEANDGDLARTFRVFDDDCLQRRIVRRAVAWEAVFTKAERLSRKFATIKDCRSFDVVHVAIALVSHVNEFATLDTAQSELARAARFAISMLARVSRQFEVAQRHRRSKRVRPSRLDANDGIESSHSDWSLSRSVLQTDLIESGIHSFSRTQSIPRRRDRLEMREIRTE